METIFEKPLDKQVAENTDHIATIEGKLGFGTTTTSITFPFTPTVDGFLMISINPSSASDAYAVFTNTAGGVIGVSAVQGNWASTLAALHAGEKITQSVASNCTVAARFIPLMKS